jgi:NAD(P)-dependent dehydrogenase (short-subunit alcohol dehydrogenase family)
LVTASSRGLGFAIAQALAAQGMELLADAAGRAGVTVA